MTFTTPGTDVLPTGKYGEQYILKEGIRKSAQAVSIQFNVSSYGVFNGQEALTNDVNTGSAVHWALIRSVQVLGRNQGGALVSLSNDETDTGFSYYDATNYAKLVDTNFGFPSVKILDDIGEVPDNVALTVGRHEMKSLLERGKIREYTYKTQITTMPLPFQTVDFHDSFSGVVLEIDFTMSGGQETTVITAMDLS